MELRAPMLPRRWKRPSRFLAITAVAWFFAYGPGGLIAPRLMGYSVARGSGIDVYYRGGVSQAVVNETLAAASRARAANLAFWGEPTGGVQPIDIYVCGSRMQWQQLGLWPAGNAATIGSAILVAPLGIPGRVAREQLITHEMSHAFLNQRLGLLRAYAVPAWVNEGIATFVAQNFWATDTALQARLAATPAARLVPASALRSGLQWRAAIDGSADAALAYGHAQSLCAFLINRVGAAAFRSYIDHSSLVGGAEPAFARTFGMSVDQADAEWMGDAKSAGRVPRTVGWAVPHVPARVLLMWAIPYALVLLILVWVALAAGLWNFLKHVAQRTRELR